MSIVRAEVIARMRIAFKAGITGHRFIADMKAAGLSYRRTDMLADWREAGKIDKVEGLLQFVRKDRYPSVKAMATTKWPMSKEFLYKLKVHSRISPDEPVTERFVNIMTDRPLTPTEMETQLVREWGEWERYAAEEITGIQVWTAVRSVPI